MSGDDPLRLTDDQGKPTPAGLRFRDLLAAAINAHPRRGEIAEWRSAHPDTKFDLAWEGDQVTVTLPPPDGMEIVTFNKQRLLGDPSQN